MNTQLLTAFLRNEADHYVRQLILDSISKHKADGYQGMQKFEFNLFNIILNFETNEITLEDVLTVGPESEYKLKMDVFESELQKQL